MSWFDWLLVIAFNGGIIAYGLFRGRETKSSVDWFLAGRTLPWWIVGLSLYATAIDSSDLVADSGGVYRLGFSYFVTNWVGTTAGWLLLAHCVAVPMYRAGMYTNAEYLEARFGPTARVISALVQVQYRTLVLGIIATTLFLTLTIVCRWGTTTAWSAVVLIALLATLYTALGGLKSVALTDALQSVVMVASSVVLFLLAWQAVGGWTSIQTRLDAHTPGLSASMLHVGHDHVAIIDTGSLSQQEIDRQLLSGGRFRADMGVIQRRTPAWLVCLSLLIAGMSYSIVNHTQSMRLFGARSERDMKMAVVVSGGLLLVMTFTNLMIGIMGRALYPDLAAMPGDVAQHGTDAVYPLMVRELTSFGLQGLVVAGILAASFSTFDSIGSTLSSLLVRDVYARLIVREREDRHYLRVGQWLTPVVIFGSFLYVPFLLKQGMLLFYLDLVASFVVPLLTVYLMGTFTRVHRKSAALGLAAGVLYGTLRLLAPTIAMATGHSILPSFMVNSFAGSVLGLSLTAGVMVAASVVLGWEQRGDLLHEETSSWLRSSRQAARNIDATSPSARNDLWPLLLGMAVVAAGSWLSFVVYW